MTPRRRRSFFFFFFNDTATTEIYTLSLHDALPISFVVLHVGSTAERKNVPLLIETVARLRSEADAYLLQVGRSEEHTSELQSQSNLVCRLLLEKKKNSPVHLRRSPLPRGDDQPPPR